MRPRISHAKPPGFSIGQTGLLSGPGDLCGICLRRIRTGVCGYRWRNGTGVQRRLKNQKRSFRRRALLVVSAKQRHRLDAGIGQIFHQRDPRSRRHRRRWAANISSCIERYRAHRPPGHEREDALDYFGKLGATRLRQTPARHRAAILRKPFTAKRRWFGISTKSRAYYDSILIQPLVSGDRIPDFRARRRGALFGAEISALCAGRWRARDPRPAGRTQCSACGPRTFAGCGGTRHLARHRIAKGRALGDSGTDEPERGRHDGARSPSLRSRRIRTGEKSGQGAGTSCCGRGHVHGHRPAIPMRSR